MVRMPAAFLICFCLIATGCDDASVTPDPVLDTGITTPDMGVEDVAADLGPESKCLKVDISDDANAFADDVSIEYFAKITQNVETKPRELSLLFERYNDTLYEGTFDLSEGADANFGTCAHCVFVLTDTAARAYFADRGTLVSNSDPYSRRLDVEVSGLRLVEVSVDPETRESTVIEDGACIEVSDFAIDRTFPPADWTCPSDNYGNGVSCDCECGAWDPDCGGQSSCPPNDPLCSGIVEFLPTVGCEETEICTVDPVRRETACTATCDWAGRVGCAAGACVFDFGVGDGDLCISDPMRVIADTMFGEACPQNGLQILCNVVDGFAQGYCSPNNVCSPVCTENSECTVAGETCRTFRFDGGLGYCGPEPTDG